MPCSKKEEITLRKGCIDGRELQRAGPGAAAGPSGGGVPAGEPALGEQADRGVSAESGADRPAEEVLEPEHPHLAAEQAEGAVREGLRRTRTADQAVAQGTRRAQPGLRNQVPGVLDQRDLERGAPENGKVLRGR